MKCHKHSAVLLFMALVWMVVDVDSPEGGLHVLVMPILWWTGQFGMWALVCWWTKGFLEDVLCRLNERKSLLLLWLFNRIKSTK